MSPALDPSVLNKLRVAMDGSGVDLVGELIAMFLVDGPRMLTEIQSAQEGLDAALLARHVHNLKGSVVNLGASRLAAICHTVETGARAGEIASLSELLKSLETELQRVFLELKAVSPQVEQ